jgi:hypothetical protein
MEDKIFRSLQKTWKILYEEKLDPRFVDDYEDEYEDDYADFEKPKSSKKEVSNKGDFDIKNGKMLFQRVGPINAQIQRNNKRAPEGRGIWAYPWPVFDWFFVSGPFSTPSQMAPKNPNHRKLTSKELELVKEKINNLREKLKNLISPEERREIKKDIEDLNDYLNNAKYDYNIEYLYKKLEIPHDKKEPTTIKLSREEIKELEKMYKNLTKALEIKKQKGENTQFSGLNYKIREIDDLLQNPNKADKQTVHYLLKDRDFAKVKKFRYGGPIYAHFAPKGKKADIAGEWYRYESIKEYFDELRRYLFQYSDESKIYGGKEKKLIRYGVDKIDPRKGLSSDHLEVFIPL